jgi:hypothetical protein
MVAKGARPGKRIALVSGVHGDEISSVRALQTVMDQLDPASPGRWAALEHPLLERFPMRTVMECGPPRKFEGLSGYRSLMAGDSRQCTRPTRMPFSSHLVNHVI